MTTYSKDKQGRVQSLGFSTLFRAATCDEPAPLKALLEHGVDDVNRGSESAKAVMSPLWMAVACNYVESVKLLLNHGADRNVGSTPKDPGGESRSPLAIV